MRVQLPSLDLAWDLESTADCKALGGGGGGSCKEEHLRNSHYYYYERIDQ